MMSILKNIIKKKILKNLFIISVLIFSVFSVFFTNQVILKDFPNSADEYSYIILAELFSNGKLSVPSPNNSDAYFFWHIINDGKYYSIYSPGWSFFLMLGIIIGHKNLINIFFSVFSIFLIYLIGQEMFSEEIARISTILMALSPFFLFNSASYFSHSSNLFFISLFFFTYLKVYKKKFSYSWLLLGMFIGISFLIRNYESVVICFVVLTHYVIYITKKKKKLHLEFFKISLFLLGFLIFLSVFLLYNYKQTGNSLVPPFVKYSPDTIPFYNFFNLESIKSKINENILMRSIELNKWIPFLYLFIIVSFFQQKYKIKHLFFIFLSIFIAYFFFSSIRINQYGPRYMYSSLFALFLIIGVSIQTIKEKYPNLGKLVFIFLILSQLILFSLFAIEFQGEINKRRVLYDTIDNLKIENAVVFLNCTDYCSGTMPAGDLTRNGIYFNNTIIYVSYLNETNFYNIQRDYPNKNYYVWDCPKIELRYSKLLRIDLTKDIFCELTAK